MDKKTIEDRLREQLNEVLAAGNIGDWFVIASNGSMNYGLDNENSDIDSKLLVVPNLKQLVNNNRNNGLHIMSDNGEHVETKDIALYMKTVLKQNINFVETLFTKGVLVNPIYQEQWDLLVEHREDIARYDVKKALDCMFGMMKQKRADMTNPTPGRQESIDKIGYDSKSFHHLMRLGYFLMDYLVFKKSYEDCLTQRSYARKQLLMGCKNGVFDYESALGYANNMLATCEDIMKKAVVNADEAKQEKIRAIIDDVVYTVIKKCVLRGVIIE